MGNEETQQTIEYKKYQFSGGNDMKKYLSVFLAVLVVFSTILAPAAEAISLSSDIVTPAAHDVEYRRDLVNESNPTEYAIGFANGQPSNGTTFTSEGGFYWTDGGLFNSVEVNLGASWGIFSISAGSVGGTGDYISAPKGVPCKLFVYKTIICRKYANYERLRGATDWTFTGYETVTEITNHRLEVRYGSNFSTIWRGN